MTVPEQLAEGLAGRYRIERQLGRGGMAVVYLAHDLRHDRPVALKVLRPELAAALGPERFLREIRLTARLDHPHILPMLDSGEDRGILWYTMPYVKGETLRELLRREVQLPLDLALDLAHQIALALDHAHREGVIHRDLKPENILIGEGQARVADFGVARALTAAGSERITEAGLVLGTPAYMSPEQAAGDREIDGRSDLYSLGCVLYEMLAGEPPFTGPTAQVVIARRLSGEAPPLRILRPTVPPGVEQVVRRALAQSPSDRYQTIGEFARALHAAVLPSPTTRETATVPGWSPAPGRRARVLAGAVLVAAAATGTVYYLRRPTAPLDPAASTIAIVPFDAAVPDSTLQRLGRELVITLGATLDGVGGIRVADAITVLAADDSRRAYSLDQAVALARRLNARSVVHGTLVRTGTGVRLDAGLFSTADLRPLARTSVSADSLGVSALTDSTAWSLLQQLWRTATPPSPSLEAVTTRSIPALRAFLDGERAMAANDVPHAAEAFAHAIQADSTFWLAYWRYAFAQGWEGLAVDSAIRAAYWTHRGSLPEQDRMLIEAGEAPRLSASYALLRAAVERFPTYWPAWLLYMDQLVHDQPYLGSTLADAREALERFTALNPDFIPVWTHFEMIAVNQRDSAASNRAVREMTRLGFDSIAERWSPGVSVHLSYLAHLVGSGGTPDSAVADRLANLEIRHGPWAPPPEVLGGALSAYGFNRAQLDLNRRVLRRASSRPMQAAQHRGMAIAWAARGAWDSALVEARRYTELSPESEAELFGYRLAAVGAWLGVVDAGTADEWRRRATSAATDVGEEQKAEIAWLDGIVAVSRQDRTALHQARLALHAVRAPSTAPLDRSLAGFEHALAGSRIAAAESLSALELELADRNGPSEAGKAHPFFAGVDRLAAARWLSEAGEQDHAARLLRWCEAMPSQKWFEILQATRVLGGVTTFERGQVEAAAGRAASAQAFYRRFLADYDMPPPAHRWMVEAAQSALRQAEEP